MAQIPLVLSDAMSDVKRDLSFGISYKLYKITSIDDIEYNLVPVCPVVLHSIRETTHKIWERDEAGEITGEVKWESTRYIYLLRVLYEGYGDFIDKYLRGLEDFDKIEDYLTVSHAGIDEVYFVPDEGPGSYWTISGLGGIGTFVYPNIMEYNYEHMPVSYMFIVLADGITNKEVEAASSGFCHLLS